MRVPSDSTEGSLFLENMSINHTVAIQHKEGAADGETEYQGASPDEVALVEEVEESFL